MTELTRFDLLWIDEPDATPTREAFDSKDAARFGDLGEALDAARVAPDASRYIPFIRSEDILFAPGHIRVLNRYRDRLKGGA